MLDPELRSGGEVYLRPFIPFINQNEPHILEYGEIILCTAGSAFLTVNYKDWELPQGGVIVFFPNDMVILKSFSEDYSAKILGFSQSILREASLDLEHTVYSTLREDRCRTDSPEISQIVGNLFALLESYFTLEDCDCLDRLVLLQLKAFFLHTNEFFSKHRGLSVPYSGSKRKSEIFSGFMSSLERDFKKCREVAYYADLLHISPKYLNNIVNEVSGRSVKQIIDHYVVLKLKQELMEMDKPVKQFAWEYNFSDPSFFTRYFKLHTGLTPQEFRQTAHRQ